MCVKPHGAEWHAQNLIMLTVTLPVYTSTYMWSEVRWGGATIANFANSSVVQWSTVVGECNGTFNYCVFDHLVSQKQLTKKLFTNERVVEGVVAKARVSFQFKIRQLWRHYANMKTEVRESEIECYVYSKIFLIVLSFFAQKWLRIHHNNVNQK